MFDLPDLKTLEQNNVAIEIKGKTYEVPASELDRLEPIFENMSEEDLEAEIKKIAIVNALEKDPIPPSGSIIDIG